MELSLPAPPKLFGVLFNEATRREACAADQSRQRGGGTVCSVGWREIGPSMAQLSSSAAQGRISSATGERGVGGEGGAAENPPATEIYAPADSRTSRREVRNCHRRSRTCGSRLRHHFFSPVGTTCCNVRRLSSAAWRMKSRACARAGETSRRHRFYAAWMQFDASAACASLIAFRDLLLRDIILVTASAGFLLIRCAPR